MRVLYLNDYSIEKTHKGVKAGLDHAAHLWGYDYFLEREDTQFIPVNQKIFSLLKRFCIHRVFGDIYREAKILSRRNTADLIIAANINIIWGLAYLKKVMDLPLLIGILHSLPSHRNPLYRMFMRNQLSGIDKIVCIARKDYIFLKNELKLPPEKISYIPWAANPEDYDRISAGLMHEPPPEDKYVISMGKSGRDYRTLVEAFTKIRRAGLVLKIYCGGSAFEAKTGKDVIINRDFINFKDSIREYKNAEFVVIPLIKTERTLGLTSLFDAMAMEKPFIITRNASIDIDVEKEKIGLWVDPCDADDLREKMLFLLDNPLLAQEYGRNGRNYLEEQYNYRRFCERLYEAAKELTGRRS